MLVSGARHADDAQFSAGYAYRRARAPARSSASYEDGWDLVARPQAAALPRTVNFITGPSRTGDIEQRIQLGAHGPAPAARRAGRRQGAGGCGAGGLTRPISICGGVRCRTSRRCPAGHGRDSPERGHPARPTGSRKCGRDARAPKTIAVGHALSPIGVAARPVGRGRSRHRRTAEARQLAGRGAARSAWHDPGRGAPGARRFCHAVARRRAALRSGHHRPRAGSAAAS